MFFVYHSTSRALDGALQQHRLHMRIAGSVSACLYIYTSHSFPICYLKMAYVNICLGPTLYAAYNFLNYALMLGLLFKRL